MESWVLPNRALFPQWVYESYNLKSHEAKESGKYTLFDHQVFVRDFMGQRAPFMGLLLYHGLGVGKTCAAIAVGEVLRSNVKQIIVMTQASLRHAFKQEMKKCGSSNIVLDQRWKHEQGSNWRPAEDGVEFADLSPSLKESLKMHIDVKIDDLYVFINYNGLKHNHLVDRYSKEYFDSSLVIIDEVHRFVSAAMKPGSVLYEVYERIFLSSAKRILLSGTPIVNTPYELSLILNLVHGPTRTLKIKNSSVEKVEKEIRELKSDPRVDAIRVISPNEAIVELLPDGFVWNADKDGNPTSIRRISADDAKMTATPMNHKTRMGFHLPMDKDEFDEMFVDVENMTVRNPTLFLRRMQGLVSHFETRDPALYPTVNTRQFIRVPMSNHQFSVYSNVRIEEIKKERRSRIAERSSKKNNGDNQPSTSIYKSFSRAVCNFAFPEGIKRPYPSKMLSEEEIESDYAGSEDSQGGGGGVMRRSKNNKEYAEALNASLEKLSKSGALEEKNLGKYSPKMAAMIKGIDASPGPCLVYSEFKTAEGMRILTMAMEARGYARLKVVDSTRFALFVGDKEVVDMKNIRRVYMRHEPSNAEDAMLLIDLFNCNLANIPDSLLAQARELFGTLDNTRGKMIHAILITVSGSEGISLKNVRQVHLLEPFWNDIRVQQVVGRAARANSHIALDKASRTIDVFMYCVFLTEHQRQNAFLLRNSDRLLSADELVFEIAQKKMAISKAFLRLIRKGSVDCNMFQENCFNHSPAIADSALVYTSRWEDDSDDRHYARVQNSPPKPIKSMTIRTGDSRREAVLMDDGTIADGEIWRVLSRVKVIGRAVLDANNNIIGALPQTPARAAALDLQF